MTLSAQDLRLLVELERKMDCGEVPFIYVQGEGSQRAAMRSELMEALGLSTGETVTRAIYLRILELNLEYMQQQLAWEKAQDLIREVAGGAS